MLTYIAIRATFLSCRLEVRHTVHTDKVAIRIQSLISQPRDSTKRTNLLLSRPINTSNPISPSQAPQSTSFPSANPTDPLSPTTSPPTPKMCQTTTYIFPHCGCRNYTDDESCPKIELPEGCRGRDGSETIKVLPATRCKVHTRECPPPHIFLRKAFLKQAESDCKSLTPSFSYIVKCDDMGIQAPSVADDERTIVYRTPRTPRSRIPGNERKGGWGFWW